MKFLIINGPNLNLLGKREPGIYGENTYESLCARLKEFAAEHGSTAECFQSNHEGAIVDAIQAADGAYDAIVMNPGAYTHYSVAILDALKAVELSQGTHTVAITYHNSALSLSWKISLACAGVFTLLTLWVYQPRRLPRPRQGKYQK